MDTIRIFNFILGLSNQVAEEAIRMKSALNNEYNKILVTGTNNNSDQAIALRETTEMVFIFIEDLKYKLSQE